MTECAGTDLALPPVQEDDPAGRQKRDQLVLDVARSVADAAGGGEPAEGEAITRIESALR